MFLVAKNPVGNAGDVTDLVLMPESGRSPEKRAWQSTLVFLPGESKGPRNLTYYSPLGHTEMDMTEATECTNILKASLVAQMENNLPSMQETQV